MRDKAYKKSPLQQHINLYGLGLCLVALLCFSLPSAVQAKSSQNAANSPFILFSALLLNESDQLDTSLKAIEKNWHPGYIAMILETLNMFRDKRVAAGLVALLEKKTGQQYGDDLDKWYRWLWKRPYDPHPHYADFKSQLYHLIDPKFSHYFSSSLPTNIRLDEVRWGGVMQDGIPPLRYPTMIAARQATYLRDSDVVFGLQHNGDARAYPKRILAWHEMFVDRVGNVDFSGVYCTLCGSVILYKNTFKGRHHKLGTSGFLFRSNKLMYDKATQSLWNTTWGKPVVGKLVGQGIELERSALVTTTWGAWKKRHPTTKVLSLSTGYKRDYAEGAAYRGYFATQQLMFAVPKVDKRLRNKDEVLTLRFNSTDEVLAISADFLRKNTLYYNQLDQQPFMVLTDASGANRVYAVHKGRFKHFNGNDKVTDTMGHVWQVTEDALVSETGKRLQRLPANRAFWFGWYAAYNKTRLVK